MLPDVMPRDRQQVGEHGRVDGCGIGHHLDRHHLQRLQSAGEEPAGTGEDPPVPHRTAQHRPGTRTGRRSKGAVPVWVVPLPNLLGDNAAEPHAFDVIIVDEASQVGLEHLFLVWMAPRVTSSATTEQCTPGPVRVGRSLDPIIDSMREHLGQLEAETRLDFTPKTSLYGLLTNRSGTDAVVRLREHLRCVPEIINWSSQQFYDDGAGSSGLVPARECRAGTRKPLRVVHAADVSASTTGLVTRLSAITRT